MTILLKNAFFIILEYIWAGWWDRAQEGNFVDVNSGKMNLSEIGYSPWDDGEPNGDTQENCIVIRTIGKWNDISCDDTKLCVACNLTKTPSFVMRGLVICQ